MYNRPKHKFKVKDLIRIGKNLRSEIVFVQTNSEKLKYVNQLLNGDYVPVLRETVQEYDIEAEIGGGGEFGGAGASGSFGTPASTILVTIIED